MMKKSIFISVLTLLFLVSTTGLPVFYHYCEMMQKRSISECEMCKVEMEKVETSCCSEEVSDNNLKLSAEKSNCCIQEFDYKKIEDDFSLNLNSSVVSFTLITASDESASLDTEKEETNSLQNNYNLPPPKFGKQLLQTIHQLKIDLLFC
jgi:hypothetical protein